MERTPEYSAQVNNSVFSRSIVIILLASLGLIASCKEKKETKKDQTTRVDSVITTPPPPKTIRQAVVYPEKGMRRPSVDSNFIFGSVGNPNATLTINGFPVPVAKSGGYLAFIPNPIDGRYEIIARAGDEIDTLVYSFASTPAPTPAESKPTPSITSFSPRTATVIKGSDTLATGSDVMGAAPTIGADRKWLFPRGTRLRAIARQGNQIQVSLASGVTAWMIDTALAIDSLPNTEPTTAARTAGSVSINGYPGFVDVRVPIGFAPHLVEQSDRALTVQIYGLRAPSSVVGGNSPDSLLRASSWGMEDGNAELTLQLAQPLWGYKVFYGSQGDLVLRIRRPPTIDSAEPLRGRKILVDAGHPPAGATGPTGLTEAAANVAISLRLADKLRAKGAEVVMVRTTNQGLRSNTNTAVELWARTELAVQQDAEVYVSVHNNAFPDGVNPFRNHGTSTYYFHSHSADLARALMTEIVKTTGMPYIGAKQRSLAVVRPTWMPAALTESLYMMFPEQEMMLRDPAFLGELADAHVRGLELFLRQRGALARSQSVEK